MQCPSRALAIWVPKSFLFLIDPSALEPLSLKVAHKQLYPNGPGGLLVHGQCHPSGGCLGDQGERLLQSPGTSELLKQEGPPPPHLGHLQGQGARTWEAAGTCPLGPVDTGLGPSLLQIARGWRRCVLPCAWQLERGAHGIMPAMPGASFAHYLLWRTKPGRGEREERAGCSRCSISQLHLLSHPQVPPSPHAA